ncbi:MAG TPA: hypothetical protein PLV70_12890 [Flavobacteriales bacterium]|nr:hypothetical protein [Flavobacteriales bacterium]HRN36821.1 hypothetical protein [Flavobacteriales bacterium]HRO40685.1 hypothetical protein [Flavobacteriales bacterium]HRP82919.1 hypothetical protein [Flavobacteriales bacterium]HRQ86004.1 hypothetical protein [Flavobacteriales bacterium]
MMKHFTLLLLVSLALGAQAQKKELLEDKGAILARAGQALDAAMQPGGALYEAVVKEQLTGTYTLQVSFREKGEVSSVFVAASEHQDIRSQNRFKDLVHNLELPFKMPKGRQYRIDKTFDLDHKTTH